MGKVLGFARLVNEHNISAQTQTMMIYNDPDKPQIEEKPLSFLRDETIDSSSNVLYSCKFYRSKRFYDVNAYSNNLRINEIHIYEDFKAFRKSDSDVVFFETNTKNTSLFVNKINTHYLKSQRNQGVQNPQQIFEQVNLNFLEIHKKFENVIGVWVKLSAANIQSTGIYGYKISSQEEFTRLVSQGNVSSLTVEYPYMDGNVKITISSKGSICIVDPIRSDDRSIIDLLLTFYEQYLR